MKERVKPSGSVNQTCDAENAEPKVKSAEFSSPLISGNFEEDMHVLQCVNNSGETGYREHENEQNVNGISASDRPTNPMSPLLSLPLSKITATEPLNVAANQGNALTDEIRTETFTEFVPKIGSDIPAQSTALQVCCGTPEDHRSPASFGANSPVNWEQHIGYTFAFQRNNGAHCGHAVQQLLNFRDGPPLVNISEKKAKSENAEEKISRSSESKAETSPGELVQETAFAGEINRKRRRRGEDEQRKSALQRKMEHLDKEKERRLRQAKCYTVLRNLVPSCDMKTDKANVLEETVAYLNYIKDILGSRIVVIDKGFLEDLKRKVESLK